MIGSRTPIVLIHGAATDGHVWEQTADSLRSQGRTVRCPTRPQSGSLDAEVAALWDICTDAVLIGVSGGATLVLELASRACPLIAGVAHEPAAGALAPGLLAHVAAGLDENGVHGFGSALYGPLWTPAMTDATETTVRREFAMFGRFEPRPVRRPVTLTVGADSPPSRHHSVAALSRALRVPVVELHDTGHSAHLAGAFRSAATVDSLIATAMNVQESANHASTSGASPDPA